jgi:hypothetical protein
LGGSTLIARAGVLAALSLLVPFGVRSAQNPVLPTTGEVLSPPAGVKNEAASTPPKQKDESKKSPLETTKTDAAELSLLADQLRDELNKINVNVLPFDVIQKTEKVEKLARKIKGEANE